MQDEFKAIIEKNLPAQVGDVLKQRLDQAEKDAITVNGLKLMLNEGRSTILLLEKQIKEYQTFDKRNNELETRERNVAERERNQKVFEAELRLAEAEKRISDNTNFVGMVFKSPVFRKTTNESTQLWNTWSQSENKNVDVPNKSITEDSSTE